MKRFPLFIVCLLVLSACAQQTTAPWSANDAEIRMAEMMGISVEELRNQTPQEHMLHMQRMMQQHDPAAPASDARSAMMQNLSALPAVQPTQTITVKDGDTVSLTPTLVRTTINGKTFPSYGYNGQIPGPLLRTTQKATFTVNVTNGMDMDTTIHWHGLRLQNASDGVPGLTQPAIAPGGTFSYTVTVPDEGVYWYHPHVREDLQQDMGLYGNIFVAPEDASLQSSVHREEVLVLDDLLLDANGLPESYGGSDPLPGGKDDVRYALMGRFGNVLLVNGEPDYRMTVARGSVVRFLVTNVANTRTFRIGIPGVRMKLVGSDIGRYEREEWVDFVTIAPAERAIVEAYFPKSGNYALHHVSPLRTATLGTITVTDTPATPDYAANFETLRSYTDVSADVRRFAPYFDAPVDKELLLTIDMNGPMGGMHHGSMMAHTDDGIEWEDAMPQMNRMMPSSALDWNLVDTATGKKNMDIQWQFQQGDIVKVRIVNTADSPHPMQHPIHFHGQRFLVLSMDGTPTENFVWKDTVLIPSGATAELLIEMSNPGDWMFHCHIAEHLSNGMMGMFSVAPAASTPSSPSAP